MASRRERRERKQAAQGTQVDAKRRQIGWRRKARKTLMTAAIVIVVAAALWWILGQDRGEGFPYGSVHWHAYFDIEVCGEHRSFAHLGSETSHYGGPTLHTHGDDTYHLEGDPGYLERASLGAFFDAINLPFSNAGILEYAQGGACPDGNSTFVVLANGNRVSDPEAYVPNDQDRITIRFG